MNEGKVFGIGFHKTATESLRRALEMLGYRVYGPAPNISDRETAKEEAQEILEYYDALQDFPWPVLYKWLNEKYQESKFILTVRSEKSWIKSVKRSFGKKSVKSHEMVYGKKTPVEDEERYIEIYRRHNKKVVEYFNEREGDNLLVMDITSGDGWEKLCPFLGFRKPWLPFPKRNISEASLKTMSLMERMRIAPENWLQLAMKHYQRDQLLKKVGDRLHRVLIKNNNVK